jgi:hypothetical protein
VRRDDLGEQRRRVDRLRVQPQRAGVGEGEVLQVVDDVLQVDGLFEQRVDQFVVEPADAVLGRFQPAADVAQRRAQLVRDVADHRLAGLLEPLAAGGHGVERGPEPGDLVAAAHLHLRAGLAGLHPLRRAGARSGRISRSPANAVTSSVSSRMPPATWKSRTWFSGDSVNPGGGSPDGAVR